MNVQLVYCTLPGTRSEVAREDKNATKTGTAKLAAFLEQK
jgi:hypothetical protein